MAAIVDAAISAIIGSPSNSAKKPERSGTVDVFRLVEDRFDDTDDDIEALDVRVGAIEVEQGTQNTQISNLQSQISSAQSSKKYIKEVDVMTTANVNLASGLAAGQVVNGVTLVANMRVFVGNAQTNPAQIGVYLVPASGAASRTTDLDTDVEFPNATILILGGTVNKGNSYTITNTLPIVVGTTPITYVQTATSTDVLTQTTKLIQKIDAPLVLVERIILDFANRHGQGVGVFLPRAGSFRNATDGEIYGFSLTGNSKISTHVFLAIPVSSAIIAIYFDMQTGAYNAVTAPTNIPLDDNRYYHIMTLYGIGTVGTGLAGVTTHFSYTSTTNEDACFADQSGALRYDPMNGTLYIGTLYVYNHRGATATYTVPAGKLYKEITGLTTSPISTIWLDVTELINNGPTNAIIREDGYSGLAKISRHGGGNMLLIGTSYGRNFTPGSGLRMSTIVRNEFNYGRKDNDRAPYLRYTTCQPAALTQSASLALGFTRGWQDSAGHVYYGGYFNRPARSGRVIARFFAEADVAGAFGEIRAYLRYTQADGTESVTGREYNAGEIDLVQEITTKLREYEVAIDIVNGNYYTGIFVGSDNGSPNAVRVFGLQYYFGPEASCHMSRADYPDGGVAFDTLIPFEMIFADGRARPAVHVHQLCRPNLEVNRIIGAIGPQKGGTPNYTQLSPTISFEGMASVIPDATLGGARYTLRDRLENGWAQRYRDVNYRHAAIVTASKRILCIGDSMFDSRGNGFNAIKRLKNMGFTITTLGTRNMTSEFDSSETMTGEGRAGIMMGDYINAVNTNLTPITSGGANWTAYLAMSNSAKAALNPFLISDSGPYARNGYAWSYANYMSRSGYAQPDAIWINLHTNDEDKSPSYASGLTNVIDGVNIMTAQIRAVNATVPIIFVLMTGGYRNSDDRQQSVHWDYITAMEVAIRSLRTGGDTAVFMGPAYAHVNRLTGFQYDTTTLNTGNVKASMSDATHNSMYGQDEYGEMLAQMQAAIWNGA